MNLALFAKLGWRLLTEEDNLWARTIAAKYMNTKLDIGNIRKRQGVSHIWQGLAKVANVIKLGARTAVRNGHNTKFWTDVWCEEVPLREIAVSEVPDEDLHACIADYWDAEGGWN